MFIERTGVTEDKNRRTNSLSAPEPVLSFHNMQHKKRSNCGFQTAWRRVSDWTTFENGLPSLQVKHAIYF